MTLPDVTDLPLRRVIDLSTDPSLREVATRSREAADPTLGHQSEPYGFMPDGDGPHMHGPEGPSIDMLVELANREALSRLGTDLGEPQGLSLGPR